ncbi:MAG TPA: hypothetical protein VF776_09365 [Sphingomicrobium sp.]
MFRKSLTVLAGSAAIVVSGPALAAPGGGGGPHGGGAIGANAGMNTSSMGPAQVSPNASFNRPMTITAPTNMTSTVTTGAGVQTNLNASSRAVVHSQGPLHASPNAIAHASPNSVLARGAVTSTALPGLTSGLTVQNSTGTSIGTVSQVITGSDGSIRAVVVTSPTGQTFRLAPTTLSISGSVVTTSSTTVGG